MYDLITEMEEAAGCTDCPPALAHQIGEWVKRLKKINEQHEDDLMYAGMGEDL